MNFKLENIIGKNNYPGKKSERLAEKKEQDKYAFNNTESVSDKYDILSAQAKDPVHPESRYNYPEEEESYKSKDSSFIVAEDVVDEFAGEDKIISSIDANLAEKESLAKAEDELRDFGFLGIIERLLESADKKMDYSEIENILRRLQSFTADYKNILNSNLPTKEEENKIERAFNENFGKIAYSSDGSIELVNELMVVVKNALKNRRHGDKISQIKITPAKQNASLSTTAYKKINKQTAINSSLSQAPKISIKKGGNKWPDTDIFKKIKINW